MPAMAIHVLIQKVEDGPSAAVYHFGFLDSDHKDGLMRVDKSTGETEILEGVASAASNRARWLLVRCAETGEFPEHAEWRA